MFLLSSINNTSFHWNYPLCWWGKMNITKIVNLQHQYIQNNLKKVSKMTPYYENYPINTIFLSNPVCLMHPLPKIQKT